MEATGTSTTSYEVGPGLAGVGELPAAGKCLAVGGRRARHSSGTPVTGPQTAQVRWQRKLEGDATPGPVLSTDATILAATNAGILYDLDPRDGRPVWTFDTHGSYGSDLSSSPAVTPSGLIL